jgi:hypothetical protein
MLSPQLKIVGFGLIIAKLGNTTIGVIYFELFTKVIIWLKSKLMDDNGTSPNSMNLGFPS